MSTKYTLRDSMRLSHPKGLDKSVGNFILRGEVSADAPAIIHGFKAMQNASSVKDVLNVLSEHKNLPWETIPTQFLKEVKVWETLFRNGALNGQALVRNVTRLARIGSFKDMHFAADYAAHLSDEKMIQRTRLHPLNFLNALVVHTQGQKDRRDQGWWGASRNKDWETSSVIAGALEDGFYKSFKYVEPANKATLIALDVSGSMSSMASGLDLSCYEVEAAMAMTVARTEPAHQFVAFSRNIVPVDITKNDSLETAMRKIQAIGMGGTDVAAPMLYAQRAGLKVETFVTFTDNETWAGSVKPFQALKEYRDHSGIQARSAVVGLNSTGFSVADPSDPGSLDIVGGDSNLPRILADFSAGRI